MRVIQLNHLILKFLVMTQSVVMCDAAIGLQALNMNEGHGHDMWRAKELENFICNLFLN